MKLDFIAGKVESVEIRRFVMDDAGDFLYDNGVESIDGLEFMECMYLNIFSKDFRKNGKTDLAPIREHCYKELKGGNPYKKAYRGLDPFNEYSMLGKVIKNNSSDFRIIRSGMKKDKEGYVKMLVVWEGTYKKIPGVYSITRSVKDFDDVPNSFSIGNILGIMDEL